MKTILIADEEKVITDTLVLIFRAAGYAPIAAYTAEEAVTTASKSRPDLTLIDVFFHGVSAIDAAIHIRDIRGCPVVLMSGVSESSEELRQLRERGCAEFTILPKPIHPSELLAAVRQILDRSGAALHHRSRTAQFVPRA